MFPESVTNRMLPVERPPSPDPVADPDAYREHLLGLLGEDDPAVVQSATPGELRALADRAGPGLALRPMSDEWSVLECVGHIFDAEVVMSGRYRWVVAHDEPPLIGYDQDLWVDRLRHGADDPHELLGAFESLRRANVAFWHRTLPEDRSRVGVHAERGPESYETMFRMLAGHDRFHTAQARRALDAVTTS
jgi:hypothetical protein